MEQIKKIAVLRVNGLGDFIFSLPALSALREAFPEAEIIYLGKKWHQTFLSKRKSPVNRVVTIPPVAGVGMEESYSNNLKELQAFFKDMQKEGFDLGVQLHGGGRFSNPFIAKIGSKFTIGAKTEDAPPLDRTVPYHYYQNEYLRWLEVVSLAGAKAVNIMPQLMVTTEDIDEAKRALGRNKQKIIILHPGATDIRRRWPVKRFSEVGDYFASKGFKIIVTGSGNEEEVVRAVVDQMETEAVNVFNKLSLNGLTGLLSLSSLVVSNDTGLLHMANALGCKTVGIYWCANLINAAPPFREKSICLGSWMVSCPFCKKDLVTLSFDKNKAICKHEASFVERITVQEVTGAAERLL